MRETDSERPDDRVPDTDPDTDPGRRRFLRLLGTGAVASTGVTGAVGAQETPVVKMGNDYFDPIGLYVRPGTNVRFQIEAGTHSATAYTDRIPSGAAPFDSGTMSEGGFEHTFDTPGTYDYYCIPHKATGMVGRVVVGEPGGPAEATPIPDGAVPGSETIVEHGSIPADEFEGDAGGTMGSGPGMMGSRPGTMNGGGLGWMALVPIGFSTALVGAVGAIAYWASRRGNDGTTGNPPAMATLRERYARGEVDEEEYAERKRRLQQDGRHGERR